MKKTNIFKKPVIFILTGISIILSFLAQGLEKFLISLKRKEYLQKFTARQDDIYIASFMESGATWVQVILHRLTTGGNMDFKHIYDISPTFETELMKIVSFDFEQLASPRLIKSHLPYKLFPRKIKGKLIYIMRDGREVAASLYRHVSQMNKVMDFDRVYKEYFLKLNHSGWFVHLAGWLKNKRKYPVLYIKYEDLLMDLEGNIRKIIDFCGINHEENQLPAIVEQCGFESLKEHREKLAAGNHADASVNIDYNIEFNHFLDEEQVSGSDQYFNREQTGIYGEMYKKYLSPFNLGYDLPRSPVRTGEPLLEKMSTDKGENRNEAQQ